MRITNNMILHNAASNINSNKILVDQGENQMTTQTKIQRPSDDPVVAVRSLSLQTRLSKINQYYETNIPDAEEWMNVTETALNNIIENITDLKKYCVQGSTGTMQQDDRKTILQQLEALQKSIFAQGNADYAGRTVFTGYRTDKTLVFTDADCDKKYNITQELSANDFEKVKYFNHNVEVPSNASEVNKLDSSNALTKDDITIQDSSYKRLRLGYDNISDVESLVFSYKNTSGETVSNTFQFVVQDEKRIPPLAKADTSGNLTYGSTKQSTSRSVKDTAGNTNTINYDYYTVSGSTSGAEPKTVYVFENEADWAGWSADKQGKQTKYVPDDAAVLIKETGDIVFGKGASDDMSAKETAVSVNYDKNSFSAGELKPEYYYDCVDNTGVNYSDLDGTVGSRLVYNRSDISYDINYTVAVNQTLTVNLQANEIFDSSVQQDMKDLTSVITNTQNAYEKREKISALMKDSDYQGSETQKKLSEWYTAASKEYDYYKDYMQDEFERVLGNCDTYLNKANLAETTLGCRGDELSMTKTRMDEQQESVTDLKSKNDNLDLSTIMMNYTAYYTAYQASLVAAGKLGQQSLLNYI
ncbi:MAG: flagellar hook-associated protein 3 [Lachnospiraceae bacterium]|uniref:Flagellar hook-associated protein 3 n=1 Tax=Candidatus Weimeria bifida TaxID=2599074 RepID=A0A6N7J3R1_9FIRM|nr:flagellar hook-associated protein 3 [Candidatus Weimeria bifida]RRF97394.1 MAG: flagellar hook-associated protein 3 [Lachnospiraceae bacterium]